MVLESRIFGALLFGIWIGSENPIINRTID